MCIGCYLLNMSTLWLCIWQNHVRASYFWPSQGVRQLDLSKLTVCFFLISHSTPFWKMSLERNFFFNWSNIIASSRCHGNKRSCWQAVICCLFIITGYFRYYKASLWLLMCRATCSRFQGIKLDFQLFFCILLCLPFVWQWSETLKHARTVITWSCKVTVEINSWLFFVFLLPDKK